MASIAQRNQDLSRFLADRYPAVKARFPGEGRRKWRLRVAAQFWALSPDDKQKYASSAPVPPADAEDADYATDDDPLDAASVDAPGLGVVVRTDFADEGAWAAFCAKLQAAEAEFAAAPEDEAMDTDAPAAGSSSAPADSPAADGEADAEDGEEEDDESDAAPVFFVLNPDDALQRQRLHGLSNLGALRLLNDVDVRPAPVPPAGTRRIAPPNRLVDCDGWQEVYAGKMLWVYDAKSNADQCVRLVSQQSAPMYGTATGDSWRARVSHICELQVNIASGAMSIDFGGMDRWDYPERVRNMAEAEQPIV